MAFSVSADPGAAGDPVLKPGGLELPLLDLAVLENLADELGSPEIARKFAQGYAGLWGQRHRRLMESLDRADLPMALDAALSLKVTSAMVGGLRLARLAEKLETTIRRGDLREGAAFMVLIAIQGQHTAEELQLRYGRAGS
ncbi:Hpt domain-containing protein [Arthrobacter oryzae]|uniref:Hpt domain-containing protein n=1 Tax=Arthrobacter oryzae TaxID=409290 RepID=A0A3N0C7I9_9MICC|nr:Hpt domain-containing protein [Arthrobacter oryzae]RNL59168.1 Hpt domain-containing protein [Arthrobacter oryzae]